MFELKLIFGELWKHAADDNMGENWVYENQSWLSCLRFQCLVHRVFQLRSHDLIRVITGSYYIICPITSYLKLKTKKKTKNKHKKIVLWCDSTLLPWYVTSSLFILFYFILFDFAPLNKYGAGIPQQHNQLLWSQK